MKQRKFLEQRTGYGRAITGDGATIQGTKYINFLAHEFSKGYVLCQLVDCTDRLSDVGSVQSTFIAHHVMAGCSQVCVCLFTFLFIILFIILFILH